MMGIHACTEDTANASNRLHLTICTANQTQVASLDILKGVHVVSDPDGTVAYENAVKEVCVY